MNKIFIIIGGVIGFLFINASLLYLGFIGAFWYGVSRMYIEQPLSQNIQVTSEWQQIEFTSPIKIKKQVQEISLRIDDFSDDDKFLPIKLQDGTILNPEVILIDENNKRYTLKYYGKRTNGVGFTDGIELPKDIGYKAILIRSDKPFKCDLIWMDYDLK